MPIDYSGFSLPKPGPRKKKQKDLVKSDVRRVVLERDGMCFLAMVGVAHPCWNEHGPHAPTDLNKLTVDHVHDEPGGKMGKRAQSQSPENMVAMCWLENVRPPSARIRELERLYLAGQYGKQFVLSGKWPVSRQLEKTLRTPPGAGAEATPG